MSDLKVLRAEIDAIDEQLVTLLNARSTRALAIGALKEVSHEPVYQPVREAEVLAHVRAVNRGPLDDGAMTRVFERIIDEARRIERLADEARRVGGLAEEARRLERLAVPRQPGAEPEHQD